MYTDVRMLTASRQRVKHEAGFGFPRRVRSATGRALWAVMSPRQRWRGAGAEARLLLAGATPLANAAGPGTMGA